jgi:hypothetical protein
MTLEGGKPLVENTDEVGWTASSRWSSRSRSGWWR